MPMRTPRVFITDVVAAGDRVRLPEAEGRHLARVLRRGPGDAVQILTQAGQAFDGRIHEVARDGLVVVELVGEPRKNAPGESAPRLAVTLGLAVVKGPAFELALRMAVELGIESVVPLFTSRTVVRWDGSPDKRGRYERIVREAAKQCGRPKPLLLKEESEFASWIESRADRPGSNLWIAVPGAGLPERPEGAGRRPAEAVFAVGPEGGFTDAEVEAALSAGWRACGFPTPVLRAPTAVALIAALALLWDLA